MAHSSGWEPPTSRLGGRLPEERAVENRIRKLKLAHEQGPMALGDLIHQHVRAAVEQAVHEELAAVLGVGLYERSEPGTSQRQQDADAHGPDRTAGADAAAGSAVYVERGTRVGVEAGAALSAAERGGERGRGERVPRWREHAAHPGCAAATAQGGAALEECGLARGRHAPERVGSVDEA